MATPAPQCPSRALRALRAAPALLAVFPAAFWLQLAAGCCVAALRLCAVARTAAGQLPGCRCSIGAARAVCCVTTPRSLVASGLAGLWSVGLGPGLGWRRLAQAGGRGAKREASRLRSGVTPHCNAVARSWRNA